MVVEMSNRYYLPPVEQAKRGKVMKIDSKDFRVSEGEKIKLEKWSTR